MRASRFLRHRAQLNRSRYALRAIAFNVLPSLVDSMRLMESTLRIQQEVLRRLEKR